MLLTFPTTSSSAALPAPTMRTTAATPMAMPELDRRVRSLCPMRTSREMPRVRVKFIEGGLCYFGFGIADCGLKRGRNSEAESN